jgi:hypothetical protein
VEFRGWELTLVVEAARAIGQTPEPTLVAGTNQNTAKPTDEEVRRDEDADKWLGAAYKAYNAYMTLVVEAARAMGQTPEPTLVAGTNQNTAKPTDEEVSLSVPLA